jgi:transposase
MGHQALALLKQLEAAAQAADDLAEATRLVFQQHPQVAIFTSFPGLGELPAARLLAKIGDDSTRFADARGLKAYADAAPVTRASGKKLVVLHRKVKNQRLATVGYLWTFAALRLSTGARAHYDRRRVAGDRTPPLNVTCSIASSAASTTASRQARHMPNIRPSRRPSRLLLDKLCSWDVSAAPGAGSIGRHRSRRAQLRPRWLSDRPDRRRPTPAAYAART